MCCGERSAPLRSLTRMDCAPQRCVPYDMYVREFLFIRMFLFVLFLILPHKGAG